MNDTPPDICSFTCPHADFPPPESAGICRTMSAVWCGQLVRLVNKNTPCEWKRENTEAPARPSRTPRTRRRR